MEWLRCGEGIVALTPAFVALPLAFRDVMVGICGSYTSLCETIGREPEEALLAPVAAALAEVKSRESTQ